ncbi:DUF2958 domain-containing protein [Methylobacterium sp. sgz302541]|uniref:DUF2958 domain-containing protein n=1 Tax=unclassified Methylobacterium TaxID=2615210 RepID=UPI003D34FD55
MSLITDDQRAQLLANGTRDDHDPRPVVRLFTSNGAANWILSELDPKDPDLAFGLCDFGLGSPEIGYVRLSEIQTVTATLGLDVQQDVQFRADKPLSAYAEEARRSGAVSA